MNRFADSERLRPFAHLVAEKAPLYRAVLGLFVEAKSSFTLHLRPDEIVTGLREQSASGEVSWTQPIDRASVDAALGSLCDWGNLEAHPDTSDVQTVEEFYHPRFLYQITVRGEAVERALEVYHESVQEPGELQTAALDDIRVFLAELRELACQDPIDEGKVHRALRNLRDRFEELTEKAQRFISGLQRTIDLQGVGIGEFLEYKEMLIDYLERFLGELVVATARIEEAIRGAEAEDLDRLLTIAGERDVADVLSRTKESRDAELQRAVELWRTRWQGLRSWFLRDGEGVSQAEILRARARSAIPALLHAIAGLNDRRVSRSDRSADLRTLARWFAQCDSDRDAHRLWRAAFGLTPSRHLKTTQETLERLDEAPVPASTSWLLAPPVHITPRLRRTGRYERRGRKNRVIDRTVDKQMLRLMTEQESEEILEAQRRLATGRPTRLSQLGSLDPMEFSLFLDLLGEALACCGGEEETVEACSGDGTLRIRLQPIAGGELATLETVHGTFTGPDHEILIEPVFGESTGSGTPADAASDDRVAGGSGVEA